MEILKSIISNVTVFTDRAQITRLAKVSLPKGENVVVFSDLPEKIEQKSIQVKGLGEAVLKDIKFKQVFHHKIQNEVVAKLVEKAQEFKRNISIINENILIEQRELEFVEKIVSKITHVAEKETAGEELNPEKWMKMVDFYRKKNEEIINKIRDYNSEKKKLNEKMKVIQHEVASIGNNQNKRTNHVEVVVENKSEKEILLSLTYIVYGAYWAPLYDIRVSTEDKNVVVEYKAQVTQNTGEAWENVDLAISTAQVNVSGTIPELSPWRVNFYTPAPLPPPSPKMYSKTSRKMKKSRSIDLDEMSDSLKMDESDAPLIEKPQAKVKTGATSVLFEITSKSTILNDNQPHKVNILIEDLSAEFTYAIIPKLSQYAYLKAKIKNETEYPFLPGETNIFLDGSFVANSTLKLIAPTEEFETSLGVDEGIKVEHKLIKKYKKNTGLISKKNNIVFEYQTIITNNKKHTHKIINYNQLPISQHEDISIELIDPKYKEDTDDLKINKEKKIAWHFELAPATKKVIDFKFSVESPKDKILDGLD